MGTELQFCQMKRVLEMGGDSGFSCQWKCDKREGEIMESEMGQFGPLKKL